MSAVSRVRRQYITAATKTRILRSRLIFHRKRGERARKLRKAYIHNRAEAKKLRANYLILKKAANKPLRLKALSEARRLVGVMESGGNNRGREVERIIREGGGLAGQPWCGWFAAAIYKRAGSKIVDGRWGAVRLLFPLTGIRRTSNPQAGDLVRYTFDHVGIFEKHINGSTIECIEGNTGPAGAVSDGDGSDGVYRKRRSTSLVRDYLEVTR